jgi:3-mercaptopyruvate sulfurtransferase SseA
LPERSAVNVPHHAIPEPSRCHAPLARARQLVDATALAGLLAHTPCVLLEVGCGQRARFEAAHIPGAAYLDTSALELPPLYNRVDDEALHALLLAHGIGQASTVVLYGRNVLAAARAAHLMLYAGVADVRLLDGGYALWRARGLPTEAGAGRQARPCDSFGVQFPLCPHYLRNTGQVRCDTSTLVSVRTWSEYSGASSGYSYIEARGDIPGARWGRAGREGDVDSMSAYQLPDGRMLPAALIAAMWERAGIVPDRSSVFYCGTGWRASLAFFYAWLMGWEQISVYDGGWFEWSADPANPVRLRIDEAVAA